eukprot:CAMPEP_0172685360 /NCGR_PEP_ID=MMETSP1074-20121228/20185_1 /TAXON_ID=2916 /ORGANISM="Ceratium fusus, Strain PA161109" /LENGTH=265 /DNA_ID=CAMNT_0013504491 /DNA_START=53 /DNA_END=850 /DNA_ORIENTATION=-
MATPLAQTPVKNAPFVGPRGSLTSRPATSSRPNTGGRTGSAMGDTRSSQLDTALVLITPRMAYSNSDRRRRPAFNKDTEEAILQSLRLKNDTRYETMERYRDSGGARSQSSHFQRILRRNRRMHGLPEEEPTLNQESNHMDISEWDIEFKESTVSMQKQAQNTLREPTASIQDRIAWQEGFDKNVRRLLQDFDFNDSPGCRLNHLERTHNWFQHHGSKTARKAKIGPNFITMDRNSPAVPGSALHVSERYSPPSQRSLDWRSTTF